MADMISDRDQLRIGIMLRGIDEIDGPGVVIRGLCDSLLNMDCRNEYVLYYISDEQTGRYAHLAHVQEVLLRSPSKLLWDQVLVPAAAWKHRLDVLFHHKFSIPLLNPCPTVVQQQGAEYWTHPQWYDRINRLYATRTIPLYCRRADRVLTISDRLADQLAHHADIPRETMETIYAAADPIFSPVEDASVLAQMRDLYSLPDQPFFFMVAKGYASVSSSRDRTYPRKNVAGTLEAYRGVQRTVEAPPPMVVAGPGFTEEAVTEYRRTLPVPELAHFPGFVQFTHMPALYTMALALVFPSYSESFGLPLVEAMSCGCPVITTDDGATAEVTGDAGLLVDPADPAAIAGAMHSLATDESLRSILAEKGRERAGNFSWDASARALLKVIEEAALRG